MDFVTEETACGQAESIRGGGGSKAAGSGGFERKRIHLRRGGLWKNERGGAGAGSRFGGMDQPERHGGACASGASGMRRVPVCGAGRCAVRGKHASSAADRSDGRQRGVSHGHDRPGDAAVVAFRAAASVGRPRHSRGGAARDGGRADGVLRVRRAEAVPRAHSDVACADRGKRHGAGIPRAPASAGRAGRAGAGGEHPKDVYELSRRGGRRAVEPGRADVSDAGLRGRRVHA